MKYRFISISLTLAFLFSTLGCSTFSKSNERNLYQVRVGESKAEVIQALGEAKEKELLGSREIWHYRIYAEDFRRAYPYTATFENDKLTKWVFDTERVQKEREQDQDRPTLRRPSALGAPY